MDALRAEAGVRTPRVVPALNGDRVVTLTDGTTGEDRYCVMFEFLPGVEPLEQDVESFEALGELTARMHLHSRRWSRPSGFARFHWDYDAAFGVQARLGTVAGRRRGRTRPA